MFRFYILIKSLQLYTKSAFLRVLHEGMNLVPVPDKSIQGQAPNLLTHSGIVNIWSHDWINIV